MTFCCYEGVQNLNNASQVYEKNWNTLISDEFFEAVKFAAIQDPKNVSSTNYQFS